MATAPPPDNTSSRDATTTPPLSSIPPPTLARPKAPPTIPSDQFKPVSLVGSATRDAHGCVVLTTAGGRYELVGDLASGALAHDKVSVYAMPQPTASSPCDLPVMSVRSVTPVS